MNKIQQQQQQKRGGKCEEGVHGDKERYEWMHTSIYKKYPLKEKNELFSKENWNNNNDNL